MTENPIRIFQSCAPDARTAARELHAGLRQPNLELVIFFCSTDYDLAALAEELNQLFAGVRVVGCTTAGEIGPAGYRNQSLCGVSFASGACTAVSAHKMGLRDFDTVETEQFVQSLLQRMEARAPQARAAETFAFLLADGLSGCEEILAHGVQQALGRIPMCGGSAGDGLCFTRTYVFDEGCFRTDSAVLLLVHSKLPFMVFKTQHFIHQEKRLIVTDAQPAQRLVKELNGRPAAAEYAQQIGVNAQQLTPAHFARYPVVVVIDGADYVRSIQKVNPDGSLTFYCAIEIGLVLRVAQGVDLVKNLEQALDRVQLAIGTPQVLLACDCNLRNLEIEHCGVRKRVDELLQRNHTIGFGSYGELFGGIHVNQTLTAVAIGAAREVAA
jgi:hypothetical protein